MQTVCIQLIILIALTTVDVSQSTDRSIYLRDICTKQDDILECKWTGVGTYKAERKSDVRTIRFGRFFKDASLVINEVEFPDLMKIEITDGTASCDSVRTSPDVMVIIRREICARWTSTIVIESSMDPSMMMSTSPARSESVSWRTLLITTTVSAAHKTDTLDQTTATSTTMVTTGYQENLKDTVVKLWMKVTVVILIFISFLLSILAAVWLYKRTYVCRRVIDRCCCRRNVVQFQRDIHMHEL